jgi:hypothetical protein
MEIKGTRYNWSRLVRFCTAMLLLFCLTAAKGLAQSPVKSYTVKDGRMYIALGKNLKESSIDSFITQYDLQDLALKQFIKGIYLDSLKKLGWKLDINSKEVFVISKPLMGVDNLMNPADKIIMAEKHPNFAEMFPAVSSQVAFGVNRFKRKYSFASHDSVVTFYLRNNTSARGVKLAGSFNDWSPTALPMIKTDSGWIANIKLGAGKYWYKFVIDGNWITDPDNSLNENDGLGNVNSVFYKTNIVFKLNGFANARRVYLSGSFNSWQEKSLAMQETTNGWQLHVYLAEGTHTYRYIVDGKWMTDPGNKDQLPNEYDNFNSVIRIGKPYLFRLEGFQDANKVVLSGSFNGWRNDELFLAKKSGGWELLYTLGAGNYEYVFLVDGRTAKSKLQSGFSGNFSFIIEPNFTFHLKGFANAKSVFLSGDFNGWSPNTFAMTKEGDEWVLKVHLSQGKHLYKFVVDGKWMTDPGNKLWEQNEHNTGNSIVWMGEQVGSR